MYFFAGLFFASKILSSGCCCSNFYSTKVCSIFCSLMTLSLESCRAPKQLFDDALLLWKKQSVFHLPSCGTFKDVVDYDVDVDVDAAAWLYQATFACFEFRSFYVFPVFCFFFFRSSNFTSKSLSRNNLISFWPLQIKPHSFSLAFLNPRFYVLKLRFRTV